VADLAGKAAAPVLLLVHVAHERPRVRRARHDPDLGDPAEVLEFLHGSPS